MRSIGEMARDSGLSVSALRFYDGAGVFGPARVDPQTGYRWYADEQLAHARLIARLRRVGMPLADISRVLAGPPSLARQAVDGHLRRLEDGLADARRELSTVRTLLDLRENPMSPITVARLTVRARELAAALDAVRFAVATDPELPAVSGILLEVEADVLRLVATDRYRLAVAQAPLSGPAEGTASVIAPVAFADELRPLLDTAQEARLVVEGDRLIATVDGHPVIGERIDQDYPDYRRLVRLEPTHRVTVDAAGLRSVLESGATRSLVRSQDSAAFELSVLTVAADGSLAVADGDSADGLRVGVNRDFLLEAVAVGGADQLVLELGGPITPLAIRFPDRADTFSLLMPVALS
ncbi:MerR family transcriptional regulator [Kitasatospora sp. GP82]|uniref:DNA polymerase III subunit beta family protein n=1 Tax=Kitasatospora sp. GP82 TaxID=3035089 RepID=UPI002474A6A2|nr:MerR family transcriptional regulator [Kitasatospora sp. GP82]MDH6126798.1 DNA-binding transcriptional MerR regulator [Kitasatospora sp. GP82]